MLPAATDGLLGVTAMETSVAAVTVRVVEPTMLPDVADIVEVPIFTVVASPAALMVAAAVLEEAQVTLAVRFCVLLSE